MKLLLDTCSFVWLAVPQGRLSADAIRHLDDPSSDLFLSDVSIWEICLKHACGKLPLPEPPRRWIPPQMSFFGIQALALDHDALYRSGELPKVHADPFDRLLAAQAIGEGMVLVSPDAPLSLLGASRIW